MNEDVLSMLLGDSEFNTCTTDCVKQWLLDDDLELMMNDDGTFYTHRYEEPEYNEQYPDYAVAKIDTALVIASCGHYAAAADVIQVVVQSLRVLENSEFSFDNLYNKLSLVTDKLKRLLASNTNK
jgi:hypothetical protein